MVVRKDVTIRNRAGIHARPAALLVQLANKFSSSITLEKDHEKVKELFDKFEKATSSAAKAKIVDEAVMALKACVLLPMRP